MRGAIERIDSVIATLDTHDRFHLAHPGFWRNADGGHPEPFTTITAADVEQGTWQPAAPAEQAWAGEYVKALAARGLRELMIWPDHCLLGTAGHQIVPALAQAITAWSQRHQRAAHYIFKGQNPRTEHYSALRAEVIDPRDPSTGENHHLLRLCCESERIFVGGQALSHCVGATVQDLIQAGVPGARFTLLRDATSPVPGCEAHAEAFLEFFTSAGGKIARTTD